MYNISFFLSLISYLLFLASLFMETKFLWSAVIWFKHGSPGSQSIMTGQWKLHVYSFWISLPNSLDNPIAPFKLLHFFLSSVPSLVQSHMAYVRGNSWTSLTTSTCLLNSISYYTFTSTANVYHRESP